MDMGERIKYLRNLKGWTQEELGTKVGMQKSAIAKYEKGNVENTKRSSAGNYSAWRSRCSAIHRTSTKWQKTSAPPCLPGNYTAETAGPT